MKQLCAPGYETENTKQNNHITKPNLIMLFARFSRANIFIFILLFFTGEHLLAQDSQELDTLDIEKNSTLRPTLMSAIFPGLGQISNKKFWKLPVVYGTFGTIIYLSEYNNKKYHYYNKSYKNCSISGPLVLYEGNLTEDQLLLYKQYYKRTRDLCYIMIAGCYVLNVMDASVDAHLLDYDISNDLSMRIEPAIIDYSNFDTSFAVGFTCRLSFK